MIDRRRVDEIFRNLDNSLNLLRKLKKLPEKELTEDALTLGAAKYYLQVSVECCIDISNHIIAANVWRRPESMSDAFVVLAENGIVDSEFLPTLKRMAQFRNRLVHLYWDVDAITIYRILQENLGDFERFMNDILNYFSDEINPAEK